jgi:hypothetical protein
MRKNGTQIWLGTSGLDLTLVPITKKNILYIILLTVVLLLDQIDRY